MSHFVHSWDGLRRSRIVQVLIFTFVFLTGGIALIATSSGDANARNRPATQTTSCGVTWSLTTSGPGLVWSSTGNWQGPVCGEYPGQDVAHGGSGLQPVPAVVNLGFTSATLNFDPNTSSPITLSMQAATINVNQPMTLQGSSSIGSSGNILNVNTGGSLILPSTPATSLSNSGGTLNLSGGTINNNGTIIVNFGTVNLATGTLSGAGTFSNSGTVNVTGGITVDGQQITNCKAGDPVPCGNNGSISMSSVTNAVLQNGANLVNDAALGFTSSGGFATGGGAASSINNKATISVSGVAGSAIPISVDFVNNNGQVATGARGINFSGTNTINGGIFTLGSGLFQLGGNTNIPLFTAPATGPLTISGTSALQLSGTVSLVGNIFSGAPATTINSIAAVTGNAAATSQIIPAFTNAGGTVTAASGILSFAGGYTQSSGNTIASPTGTLDTGTAFMTLNGGTLTGSGLITATSLINNLATINPNIGATAGTINLTGTYTQGAGGSLTTDLFSAIGYDQFLVSGSSTLGGTYNAFLQGGYAPANGTLFTPMTYASHAGIFGTYNLPTYPGGSFSQVTGATSLQLTAVVPPPTITNGPPPGGTVGVPYSFTYTSTGFPTFTATGLPPGLTLSPAGILSGTPTTTGTYPVTVTASNGTAPNATQTFSIIIAPPPPTITNGPPPNGTVGVAYSFTYTATNSPTFSATGLPPGLTLSAAGILSGTPTTTGTYPVTVTATNGTAPNATQTFSIIIAPPPPTITNGPPPNGTVGVAYSFTYTATNSPTFSATSLPPGLTLSAAGILSGTPTTAGTYPVTVTASNGTAPNATQTFSITIAQPPPTIISAPPPNGTLGVAYSFAYSSTGSPTFSATGLPPGLILSSAGVISGTPTTLGTFTGTVTASNGTGAATQAFSITIVAACPSQPPTLISPTQNATVSSPVTFTWSAVPGAVSYSVFVTPAGEFTRVVGVTSGTSLTASVPDGVVVWYVVADAGPGCQLQSSSSSFNLCTGVEAPIASLVSEVATQQKYFYEWLDNGAAGYEVEESNDAGFTSVTTIPVNGTSLTLQHAVTKPTAFFYRVRGFSTCQKKFGPYSGTARVVITPILGTESEPSANGQAGSKQLLVIPVHIPGFPEGTFLFSATVDQPWLTVTPPSGKLPPAGLTLLVTADPVTLPNGTWTGTLFVTVGSTPAASGVHGLDSRTVTVPVSVNLVTPVATAPKGLTPPTALIIPSVGHLDGQDTRWQSDIRLANVTDKAAKYQLVLTPLGSDATKAQKQTSVSVESGGTMALDDIIRNWFGIGSLGESSNGTLQITPVDATGSTLNALVSSRTYDVTGHGTFGQFIPAVSFSKFVGKGASILGLQQIAQSEAFRTNLGLVEGSGQSASLIISAFDGSGKKVLEVPVDLKGGEQKQLNSFLAQYGVNLADGRIEVRVANGLGKVTAYASVIDRQTGDPLLVAAQPLGLVSANRYVLPAVTGLTNAVASLRTDMRLFNPATTSQPATLTFYPENNGTPQTANVLINAGEVKRLDDVLQTLFGTSGNGAVHVVTPNASSVVVTGRTYNQTTAGTYGQFVPAVTANDAIGKSGRSLNILQVEESVRYRTSVGVAEVTGNATKVEVSVVVPGSKVSPSFTFDLAPNEVRQFDVLHQLGLDNVYNVRIGVKVLDGTGKVTAFGSIVDLRTQDPTFVPAQ